MNKSATALFFVTVSVALLNLERASSVFAAPLAQSTPAASSPTPTDEPPKPPYVFPTPIFIPTSPGDTPIATAASRTTSQPAGQDTYTVQSGDSPWTIAQKVYGDGTKYPLIMTANGLTSTTRLRVGSVLKIPALAGTLPAPTATPPASALTSVPTRQAPTAANPVGRSPTPTATLTAPPAGGISKSASDLATMAINILAAILVLGAFVAAILAFLAFSRTRRMAELDSPKRRLQIRQ